MKFNNKKLRLKIIEKFGTQSAFAMALGIGKSVLSLKMHGKINFSPREMRDAVLLLGIDPIEMWDYFFTL